MNDWEVTFEDKKKKLKRNRYENFLALNIMQCRELLKHHIYNLKKEAGLLYSNPKRIYIYEENVRKLNRFLRDYKVWYNRTQKTNRKQEEK
tara:strand:+ start:575 stop:847 length:273 start_codon:yes stop_codon:yes gene_type:complete